MFYFSFSSTAARSYIQCKMKIIVLVKEGFILLMYKVWGRKYLQESAYEKQID